MNLHTNVYSAAVDARRQRRLRVRPARLPREAHAPTTTTRTSRSSPTRTSRAASGPTFTGRPRCPRARRSRACPSPARSCPQELDKPEAAGVARAQRRPLGPRRRGDLRASPSSSGFTKDNPFDNPYEVKAAFRNVNDLKPKSPVRIAGVNVGKVKKVEPLGDDGNGAHRDDGDQREGPADPPRRAGQGPPAHLPRGQLLRRPPARARRRRRCSTTARRSRCSRPPRRCSSASSSRRCRATRARTCGPCCRSTARRSAARAAAASTARSSTGSPRSRTRRSSTTRRAACSSTTCRTTSRGARRVAEGLDRDPERAQGASSPTSPTTAERVRRRAGQPLGRDRRAADARCAPASRAFGALRERVPVGAPLRPRHASRPCASSGPALDAHAARSSSRCAGSSRQPELQGLVSDLRPTVPDARRAQPRRRRASRSRRALLGSCNVNVHHAVERGDGPRPELQAGRARSTRRRPSSSSASAAESRTFDANGQYVRSLRATTRNYAYGARRRALLLHRPAGAGRQPAARRTARRPYRPDVPCETQERPDLRTKVQAPPQQIRINQNAPGRRRAPRARPTSSSWTGWRDELKRSRPRQAATSSPTSR